CVAPPKPGRAVPATLDCIARSWSAFRRDSCPHLHCLSYHASDAPGRRKPMRTPALLLTLALFATAQAGDWPAFRGGQLGGVPAKAPSLPDKWDAKTNIKWSVASPAGWSSPIVSGGRVFITSATSSAKQPESRKGLYITDLNGKTPAGTHAWEVICLDADSGKVLWRKEAFKGKLNSTLHIKNSLASETPVTDGERIYSVFGNVGIICHDR